MARRRKGRRISGILLLDKPAGISSNAALQKVKWLYKAAKAGHTGSLDPLATGLLPVCLGEATKASAFLLDADKRYVTSIKLGAKTSTADPEGEIIETAAIPDISLERLGEVLEGFLGDIQQLPPMYSAVKHKGERLYKLAREGLEVERAPRTITIHDLVCLDFDSVTLQLEIHCSKGTYVRTLAEDISEALGTLGHVAELRRTAVGPFTDADMVSIEQLEARAADAKGRIVVFAAGTGSPFFTTDSAASPSGASTQIPAAKNAAWTPVSGSKYGKVESTVSSAVKAAS